MRKIDKVTDFNGKEWKLFGSEIEEEYYNKLDKGKYTFSKLTIPNVQSKMPAGNILTAEQEHIVKVLILFKKEFILASPKLMQECIDVFNKPPYAGLFYDEAEQESTPFGKVIAEILNYKYFRTNKKTGLWLAQTLNIKSCPYCNSQYTIVVKHGETHKAKFQFDHFFPKSRYPYFSLSLYNLIPSCASCNLSKKETDFNIRDYVHPYISNFSDEFKIKLADKSADVYLLGSTRIEIKDINLTFDKSTKSVNSDKFQKHDDVFNFISIYDRHKDIVQDLLHKIKFYPETRINELAALQSIDGKPLFSDPNEIKRILYGHFADEDDINKRPLTKLMIDISENAFALKSKMIKP